MLAGLEATDRRDRHRRVAAALEAHRDDTPERTVALAHHCLRAEDRRRAAGYAIRAGDTLRRAQLHHVQGRSLYLCARTREAIAAFQKVLPLAAAAKDEELQALPSSVIGRAMVVQGSYVEGERLLERAIEPLERLGRVPEWIATVGFYGACRAVRDNYPEGVALAQRAVERARREQVSTSLIAAKTILGTIYRTGREYERLRVTARKGVELAQAAGERVYLHILLGLEAWASAHLGEHRAASRAVAQAHEVRRSLGGSPLLHELLRAAEAEIALLAGRGEEAADLARRALEVSRASANALGEALAHGYLAAATGVVRPLSVGEVDGHFETGIDRLDACGVTTEAAHLRLTWARVLARRGDLGRARPLAGAAARHHAAAGLPANAEWSFELDQEP